MQATIGLPKVGHVLRTPESRFASEMPERFDRVVIGNGGLPTGATPMPRAFRAWRAFARWSPWFPIGRRYKTAARLFPGLVPAHPDDPERANNERAWEVFRHWDKPLLTLFSSHDPITRGGDRIWQALVPGARGQPHATMHGAGHFLQEDKGAELAEAIVQFIRATPAGAMPLNG